MLNLCKEKCFAFSIIMLNTEGGQVVEAIRRRKSVTYQSIVNMLYYTGVLAIKTVRAGKSLYPEKRS